MNMFGVLAANADKLVAQIAIFVIGFMLAWWLRGVVANYQLRRHLKKIPHLPE